MDRDVLGIAFGLLQDIGFTFERNGFIVPDFIPNTELRCGITELNGLTAEKAREIRRLLRESCTCLATVQDQLYEVYGVNYANEQEEQDDGFYYILTKSRDLMFDAYDAVERECYRLELRTGLTKRP